MTASLAELFARDPRELSAQDIDEVVKRYREAQAQFNLGARAPGSTKKMMKLDEKIDLAALGLVPKATLDLSALGLLPPTGGAEKASPSPGEANAQDTEGKA